MNIGLLPLIPSVRITPDVARAAYTRTGLKPARHLTLDSGCACPIGAIYAAATGATRAYSAPIVARAPEGPFREYLAAFVGGFDGDWDRDSMRTAVQQLAYDDGRDVALAVLEDA